MNTQLKWVDNTNSLAFRLGVMLKEARKEANLTQDELAQKTGTKKVIYLELKEDLATFRFLPTTSLLKLGLENSYTFL